MLTQEGGSWGVNSARMSISLTLYRVKKAALEFLFSRPFSAMMNPTPGDQWGRVCMD